MTPRSSFRVKVIGQGNKVKQHNFRPQFSLMGNFVMVKGYMGKGQRSLRSKSKVTQVKVSI